MRRLQQPLELTVPAGTGDRHAHVATGDDVTVRVSVEPDSGRMVARCPSKGGFDNPPSFSGVLRRTPHGVAVSGVITESTLSTVWLRGSRIMSIAAAVLALVCAVLLVVGRDTSGWGPLVICLGGAVVFGWLHRGFRKARRPEFSAQAGALTAQIETFLRQDSASRTRR